MQQLLLFADPTEDRLMAQSSRFASLGEDERRFVCAYLRLASERGTRGVPRIADVGEAIGIGRTKAYQIWKKGDVLESIRLGAQAHSDAADAVGSLALDLLLLDALQRIKDRTLTSTNISPATLRLLQDAKARLGLVPGMAAAAGITLPDGTHLAAAAFTGSGEQVEAAAFVDDLVSKLRAGTDRTRVACVEEESAEGVRAEAVAELAGECGEDGA